MRGDLLVAEPLPQQRIHIALARRQRRQGARRAGGGDLAVGQGPDAGRHVHAAGEEIGDGAAQLHLSRRAGHHAGRPGGQAAQRDGGIVGDAHRQRAGAAVAARHPPDARGQQRDVARHQQHQPCAWRRTAERGVEGRGRQHRGVGQCQGAEQRARLREVVRADDNRLPFQIA